MRETPHAAGTLEPMSNLDRHRQATAALLREYAEASPTQRTILIRKVAENMVDAREQFLRPDGTPDWKGRTHAYRQWARDVYLDSGVPADQMNTVQAAVRYHIGSVLRERLDNDALEEYGLIMKTPRERSADRRTARTAVIHALESRELAGGAMVGLSAVMGVLSKLPVAELQALDPASTSAADAALREIEKRAQQLRGILPRAGVTPEGM